MALKIHIKSLIHLTMTINVFFHVLQIPQITRFVSKHHKEKCHGVSHQY